MSVERELKELILRRNKSVREFALEIDMPYSTIDSIFKRGVKNAGVSNIQRICKRLEISADELAEGRITRQDAAAGPQTAQGRRVGRAYERADINAKNTVDEVLEPYFPSEETPSRTRDAESSAELFPEIEIRRPIKLHYLPVSAGTGVFLDGNDYEVIDAGREVPSSASFGVRISGDSMEPKYPDGDIAWVKLTPSVDIGQVGVFMVRGEGYIKKLGHGELISLNPAYDPIQLPEDSDEFRVYGQVVGVSENVY